MWIAIWGLEWVRVPVMREWVIVLRRRQAFFFGWVGCGRWLRTVTWSDAERRGMTCNGMDLQS